MAITTTPLGFKKPDGREVVRNMDNVISENADTAEREIQKALALVKTAVTGPPGKDGSNVLPTAAAVAQAITTPGSAANTALTATFAERPTNGKRAVGRDELYFNVRDYGAKGDGVTDDTAAFVAANDWAAQVNGTVVVPGSAKPYIVDDLRIPNTKGRWIGLGSGIAGIANGTTVTKAGAVLKRKAGSTNRLLTLVANGVTLENLFLDGNDGPGTVLQIDRGFECKLDKVFIEHGGGIGLDFQGSCNTSYRDVFVNRCGSDTLPAVRVNPGPAGVSVNTMDFYGLTIEQPRGVALDIGLDQFASYPEFVRIINLHIELDNLTTGNPANTKPMVLISNARSVAFINPFIVSGPGPLIRYQRSQNALGNVLGGVQVIGGTLLGRDDAANKPVSLVELVTGNGFAITGTRLETASGQAISIAAGFGDDVSIGANSVFATTKAVTDARDLRPTMTAGAQSGMTPPAPAAGAGSNDRRGAFFFGSGATPAAGEMVKVTFRKAFDRAPTVNLTPGNAATSALGVPYVDATTTGFSYFVPIAPAASQPVSRYFMNYKVTA